MKKKIFLKDSNGNPNGKIINNYITNIASSNKKGAIPKSTTTSENYKNFNSEATYNKNNTMSTLDDNMFLIDNIKSYETLILKIFKFLKEKVDSETYEEFKNLIRTHNNESKLEDSISSIQDILHMMNKNSRNVREKCNSGQINFLDGDNLNDRQIMNMTIEQKMNLDALEKNQATSQKNAKNLKLSFDFSVKNNPVKSTTTNIASATTQSNSQPRKNIPKATATSIPKKEPTTNSININSTLNNNLKAYLNYSGIANKGQNSHKEKEAQSSHNVQNLQHNSQSIHSNPYKESKESHSNSNSHHVNPANSKDKNQPNGKPQIPNKPSAFNLIKVESIASKFKNIPSKTESNSKSRESSESNRLNSISKSKSKSKINSSNIQPASTPSNSQKMSLNLNKLNNVIGSSQKNMFLKLNNNNIKQEPSMTINRESVQLQKKEVVLNGNIKPKVVAGNSSHPTPFKEYSNKAKNITKRHTKPSDLSLINNLNNINNTTLSPKSVNKRNLDMSANNDKKLHNTINNNTNTSIENKKNNPSIKLLDLTYNVRESSSLSRENNNKRLQEKTMIEIKGENTEDQINQNNEMIKEIKLNLDENLKQMFDFSYENFLNKEAHSESHSTKKSEISDNEFGINKQNDLSFDEADDKVKQAIFKK